MLGLDKPASPSFSALEREHRKRLWWTTYCLDKNTSAEMGWKPAYISPDRDLGYPADDGLAESDLGEFSNHGFLTAQVKLTELKVAITDTAYRLKAGSPVTSNEVKHCLGGLQNWKLDLHPDIALDLTSGIPRELSKVSTIRTSSSLFLKHNHVSNMDSARIRVPNRTAPRLSVLSCSYDHLFYMK